MQFIPERLETYLYWIKERELIRYRKENENSSFIADLSLLQNYKSTSSLSKNSITHIFSKFKKNLKYENFIKSDLSVSIEKTSNNLYSKFLLNHPTYS